MKRRPWVLLASLGLALAGLGAHRSSVPVVGRYSAAYFAFLVVASLAAIGVAGAWLDPARRARLVDSAARRLRALWDATRPGAPPSPVVARAVGLAFALHLALLFVFLPPASVFSTQPILAVDDAHHFHQVKLATEAFAAGRTWSYDPTFCAGYPEGTIFDVDVKLVEVTTFALTRVGIPLGLAFNLTILLFFASVPALLLAFCRRFTLGARATLLVLFTGVLLWHAQPRLVLFDSVGIFGFVFAVYWSLYAISAVHAALARGGARAFVELGLALAVGFHAHVLAPVLLVAPAAALYAVHFRALPARRHAALLAAVGVAVVANLWWLENVVRFWGERVSTRLFPPMSFGQLAEHVVGMKDPTMLLAALGLWGFARIRRRDRALGVMGLASVSWFFALTYVIGGLPLVRSLEPARFQVPCAVSSMLGFGVGLGDVLDGLAERPSGEPIRLDRLGGLFPALAALAFVAVQLLAPHTPFAGAFGDDRAALAPLTSWLDAHAADEGRVALMDVSPGFLTAAKVAALARPRAYIGGPFKQLDMKQALASFTDEHLLGTPLGALTDERVAYLLDLYDVRWLVTTTEAGAATFRSFPGSLEPTKTFVVSEGARPPDVSVDSPFAALARPSNEHPVTIFRVRRPSTYFLEGAGSVTAARDRLDVADASPGRIVLKYQWTDALVTTPPLPLRRHPVDGSPVGFIEVDNGDARAFTIHPR